ncbi:MAG: ExbD/TolR family protein [Phycisphaerales bacterium]
MNFRSPHRRASRIPRLPLVALIDVVLFLLMYFMLATDMGGEERQLAATLKADSKAGSGGSGSSALRPQIVQVEPAAGGYLFRIGDRVAKTREALTQVLAQLPKDNGVVVRVSPDCSVEAAAAAIQACKDAGFVKVSYVPASE